jgi:hypothetical protein
VHPAFIRTEIDASVGRVRRVDIANDVRIRRITSSEIGAPIATAIVVGILTVPNPSGVGITLKLAFFAVVVTTPIVTTSLVTRAVVGVAILPAGISFGTELFDTDLNLSPIGALNVAGIAGHRAQRLTPLLSGVPRAALIVATPGVHDDAAPIGTVLVFLAIAYSERVLGDALRIVDCLAFAVARLGSEAHSVQTECGLIAGEISLPTEAPPFVTTAVENISRPVDTPE